MEDIGPMFWQDWNLEAGPETRTKMVSLLQANPLFERLSKHGPLLEDIIAKRELVEHSIQGKKTWSEGQWVSVHSVI